MRRSLVQTIQPLRDVHAYKESGDVLVDLSKRADFCC